MYCRIQVDLYNLFRRDYNLEDLINLDYVAGYFMSGEIKKYNYDGSNDVKIIETQNTLGLVCLRVVMSISKNQVIAVNITKKVLNLKSCF